MAKKTVLGRGFDSLIPKDLDASILEEDKHRVQKLLITDIKPNVAQPRREFDKAALAELSKSIERHGILQPIVVIRSTGEGGYQIVAGERRWRAAKQAKLTHMPAIVRSLAELDQLELSLIENIQRVDLSPLEQAMAVYKLQQQFNLALEEVAEKLGKAPSTVSNLTRLLQLPEAAREALRGGRITEGHARAILSLRDKPVKQSELLSCILNNEWTVRQAEQYVLAAKKGATSGVARSQTTAETALTKKISAGLGFAVAIKHTARGGQLIISFRDEADLEKLSKRLQK